MDINTAADLGGFMQQFLIEHFIGSLVIIGLALIPKRRSFDEETIYGLRVKMRQQRGMIRSAQADSASVSAASDTRAKKYQRKIQFLEDKHRKELEKEKRKHPRKMP